MYVFDREFYGDKDHYIEFLCFSLSKSSKQIITKFLGIFLIFYNFLPFDGKKFVHALFFF